MTLPEHGKRNGCPDPATLRYVAENRLAEAARPEIAAHTQQCPDCSKTVNYYRLRKGRRP